MDAYVEILGFTASALSFVLWLPQAALVWRCRRRADQLGGVSMSSQVLLLMNACLWGAYAVFTGSLWVGAPGLVNGPLALVTILLLRHGRAVHARVAPGAGAR